VYGVATLELMVCSLPVAKAAECVFTMTQVHWNRSITQSGENTWGFGQIIAIILTLGNLIDVVVAIRDWRSKEVHIDSEVQCHNAIQS
jgi:hypothetical protein